ncbi:DUF6491 family protein [Phenylobacterium sp.]|uniref:DUF6491 family protein n=1 Tax=Phenylobacterium sp. TaxID=1871053 RepID=UPI0028112EBB|nr:DUF6491 family protein [Phenylobacterium sp.]
MKPASLSLLAAAGLAACSAYPLSPPPEPLLPPAPAGASLAGGDCFRTSDIRNHTILNSRTLLLRVNRGEVYRVTMAGACLAGAISSDPLVMNQPPGSPIVCRPLDFDVGVSKGGIPNRCIVESIDRLPPEQVDALPRKLKP